MTSTTHILIVDDDPEIRNLLAVFLQNHDFKVSLAADGVEMSEELKGSQIDLIVLDVMLPGENGLSLCRNLRATSNIPIIMLTAMGEDTDRIVGLEMGADDYLAKPFNPRELVARIKAILRRSELSAQRQARLLCFEGWQLNLDNRELKQSDGTLVPLSAGEYNLLQVLAEHPQQALSRDLLLERTKGRESGPYDRSIDVQLSRLRRKIEVDPKQPTIIKTIRGGGYMFSSLVTRQQ